ncbi:hypothetical protein C7S16_4237 [Burkholderia thailandensis]|uniref:Uncharacterized protein n=1 Tax=Burkholderia thailandensis TaxID=57975 RepID=A0AAW9CZX6_BURTH|nr:hypothetical protein [Burkholderia thailandensis]
MLGTHASAREMVRQRETRAPETRRRGEIARRDDARNAKRTAGCFVPPRDGVRIRATRAANRDLGRADSKTQKTAGQGELSGQRAIAPAGANAPRVLEGGTQHLVPVSSDRRSWNADGTGSSRRHADANVKFSSSSRPRSQPFPRIALMTDLSSHAHGCVPSDVQSRANCRPTGIYFMESSR